MTDQGYRNRVFAAEWHAELWRRNGVERGRCEVLIAHATECIDADYYQMERPVTDDAYIEAMVDYLDSLFRQHDGVLVSFA